MARIPEIPDLKHLLSRNLVFVVSLSNKASVLFQHVVNVLSLGSKPQMVWPDAKPAIAPMQDAHSLGNAAEMHHPRHPVRSNWTAFKDVELSVSIVLKHGPRPQPAPVRFWALNYSLPKRLADSIVDLHVLMCALGLQARRAFSF